MSSKAAAATLALCAIANLTACGDRAPKNNNEADAGGPGAYLDGQLTEDAAVTPCGQDADCPGAGPCLVGVCDAGYCTQRPAPEGTACDDGDLCTASDGCADGACDGAAVICDDGDPCTVDSCDAALGCTVTMDEVGCDDGDVCTTDSCEAGVGCVHTPIDCDNENPCSKFACEADTGCVYTPLADDTTCAGSGTCIGGYCQRDGRVLVPRSTFWTFCDPETDPICAGSIVWSIPSFKDTQELVHVEPYWIDLFEVTEAQYLACVAAGVCPDPAKVKSSEELCAELEGDSPIICATWSEAQTYCIWRGGSLPTEAQWELAGRGGCDTVPSPCREHMRPFPWGHEPASCEYAIVGGDSLALGGCGAGSGWPIGSRSPAGDSIYGLRDMVGNAYEWMLDSYVSGDAAVAVLEKEADHVARGFGIILPQFAPMWIRWAVRGETSSATIGFRCAADVQP